MGGGGRTSGCWGGEGGKESGANSEVWVYLASEADIVQLDGEVLCYSKH